MEGRGTKGRKRPYYISSGKIIFVCDVTYVGQDAEGNIWVQLSIRSKMRDVIPEVLKPGKYMVVWLRETRPWKLGGRK